MMESGSPNFVKSVRSSSITAFDEVVGVHTASIHFECASTVTRMYFPWKGPVAIHPDTEIEQQALSTLTSLEEVFGRCHHIIC